LLIGGKKIYKQISGFFLNNARASLIIIQHNIRTQVLDTISIFIPTFLLVETYDKKQKYHIVGKSP